MARIRTDNVFGTVSDNPLTGVATTMNGAGLANLAVVSGSNEAIIVLDPNRVNGAPEIVVVTAHTGSATSATITRGQFGTAARQHAQGTEWVHGPIASNASSFATAADDQGDFVPLGAWESYTPTLTQSGTVTHTATKAAYTRIGRTVVLQLNLAVTGSGTAANNVTVTVPVAPASNVVVVGEGHIFDTSASLFYPGMAQFSGSVLLLRPTDQALGAGALGTLVFTAALASGDIVRLNAIYEAAS